MHYSLVGKPLRSDAVRVRLSTMPAYLKCRVTGDVVGPCWADRSDTEKAAGSSELLEVTSDWTTNRILFSPRTGWNAPIVERGWDRISDRQVDELVGRFLEACRGISDEPAPRS